MQPNRFCFTILINAWSKQQTSDSIRRAEAILNHMEELFLDTRLVVGDERMNAYGYNAVMSAHVRSGEKGSAHRVQELFDRMTRLSKQHSNPEMLPDRVSYTTLMQAWIQERDIGFAERVEQLLNEMSKAFQDTRQASLKPDVISYGCAIDAWSKSGEPNAANRAETLLRQMQRLYEQGDASLAPNDTCFNSIINTHSKAGNAEQAESVLQWMEESYRNGNKSAKADSVSYSSCIDAWARCELVDAVDRSQALFVTMVDKYNQGDTKCKPSAMTFTSLMKALANSGSPDAARLAKENLRVLQELGVQLNTIAYNALIYACSCATGDASAKYDALELAMTTFHTMRTNKSIGVDFITYNSLLHVVSGLISDQDERQKALEDVFRKCRKDDKVHEIVLATMNRLASPLSVERLLNDDARIGETSQQ
jgi:pentatricopeptide repeat protein